MKKRISWWTLGLLVVIILAGSVMIACGDETATTTVDYEGLVAEISQQEATLVFDKFDNEEALKLGLFMIDRAKEQGKGITVDIARNGQQLFHVALPGTSADNDRWVDRKNAIVNRTYSSSLKVWYLDKLYDWEESFDMTYHEMWGFDYEDAAHLGGSFPLQVKGVGCVGTITVSGLPHTEDHAFLVECLEAYLNQ
jgi:uncharacterized protein (UPF0303 family)